MTPYYFLFQQPRKGIPRSLGDMLRRQYPLPARPFGGLGTPGNQRDHLGLARLPVSPTRWGKCTAMDIQVAEAESPVLLIYIGPEIHAYHDVEHGNNEKTGPGAED